VSVGRTLTSTACGTLGASRAKNHAVTLQSFVVAALSTAAVTAVPFDAQAQVPRAYRVTVGIEGRVAVLGRGPGSPRAFGVALRTDAPVAALPAAVPAGDASRRLSAASVPAALARESFDVGAWVGRDVRAVSLGWRLRAHRAASASLFVGASGGLAVRVDDVVRYRGVSDEARDDDVRVVIDVAPGAHTVWLDLERPASGPWRLFVRWLGPDLVPLSGDAVALEVDATESEAQAAAAEAIVVRERREVDETGALVARVEVSAPYGGLADVAVPVRVTAEERDVPATAAVSDVPSSGAAPSATATYELPLPPRGEPRAAVRIGPRVVTVGAGLPADRALAEAIRVLRGLVARASEPARAPLAWRLAEAERALDEREPDAEWRRWLVSEARSAAAAAARGLDPFALPQGYVRMAYRARTDGALVPYELYVPLGVGVRREGPRGAARVPLLVTLHGLTGNAGEYFRKTFGLSRPRGWDLDRHGRHGEPPTRGPYVVVAPTGRGRTHYRYAGEEDVLEVIADVAARLPIDPDRIYVTGGSMGGTGAAYLSTRHPHLFAAAMALCGYHDQRVRRDTIHDRLAPWERFLLAERSDVDWADNLLHVPMLLVRGTRDLPLEWTRNMVDRLRALGYRHEHREPVAGHDVWTETYADGGAFRWPAAYRRVRDPARVRLVTGRERHARAFWVSVDEREAPDRFASVDAARDRSGRVVVRTEGVRALTLHPGDDPGGPPQRVSLAALEVDGQAVGAGAALPLPSRLRRGETDGRWRLAIEAPPPPGPRKGPGVSGPIRDVFHEPLLFVLPTGDPAQALAARLAVRDWARPAYWDVRYPVVDDVELTPSLARAHTLVFLGSPDDNRALAPLADRLPIRWVRGPQGPALEVGGRRYTGPEVGTVFVAPHPDQPERVLVVIGGVSPLGIWRSRFLPDLLPDYVVFDGGVAPARGRFSAGGSGASFLEAGFFDAEWRPPTQRPPVSPSGAQPGGR
jgi:predicted esterase